MMVMMMTNINNYYYQQIIIIIINFKSNILYDVPTTILSTLHMLTLIPTTTL